MERFNYEEYLKIQIKKINELKSNGCTDREIIDRNQFSPDALKKCGLPVTYLIPRVEPQEMDLQEWDTHTSYEHKWEYYNGTPFGDTDERDKIMLGLIYSAGLKHLLEILPEKSKEELTKLIIENKK